MKKIVRTVWISALTGLAFLVACTSQNRLTRSQKKQLRADRTVLIEQLEQHVKNEKNITDPKALVEYKSSELTMRNDLAEINRLLKIDETESDNNNYHIGRLTFQIDSLQNVIKDMGMPKPPPCVYGPPPVRKIRQGGEGEKLYGPPVNEPVPQNDTLNQKIMQLEHDIDSLRTILKQREGACVYGSPEVLEKRKKENSRLRTQIADLEQQLKALKKE